MAIRDELVASAVQFLQDPSVSSSSVENRLSFLRSKNLTQEEIDVAMARASGQVSPPARAQMSGPPQPYYQQYPPYAWQASPPQQPRRDWRDWFIMATVVGGASYGLYSLGKRYVYPLIAPPTPERLEQDKKSIEEQFDKAFSLVEQLAKDTEELKNAEKDRTERLDTALSELESVMTDLKSANRRREDDATRIREEVQALKDAIPKAMNNQKDLTDNRLRELNTELSSLKTLISQRMSSNSSASSSASNGNGYNRTPAGNPGTAATPKSATVTEEENEGNSAASSAPKPAAKTNSLHARSGANGASAGQKASIPAWQLAMSSKSEDSPSAAGEDGGAVQEGPSSSS